MKKKIVSLALAVCLLAVAIVGGTLAYFTDYETDKNVMTMGNIDIVQVEQMRGENGALVDFTDGQILLPMGGDPAWAADQVTINGGSFKVFASENVIDKFVTVENNGNSAAYIRTIVALEAGKTWDEAKNLWYNNIAVTDNSDGQQIVCEDNDLFVEIDGTYYIIVVYTYTDALVAGDVSEASLTGVGLYKDTTKEDMANFGGDYEVLVITQAVQAADMGDDAGAALDTAFGDVNETNVKTWFANVA